jgi:nitroreductase
MRLMRSMRVVRRFSDRPVPDDVLQDVLEVGRWTGSSKNTQPWHVIVVRDRATLEGLSKLGQFAGHLAGAQVGLVLVMESATNVFDCGRLAERLMLAAWAQGVGSCIGTIWPDDNGRTAKMLLGIPEERWMRQTISLGYPADGDATRVRGTRMASVLPSLGRTPLSEFVFWERYGAAREP